MSNEHTDQPMDATMMAVSRTVMAADRSLMAWVRTGLSLISFGFTIYKFLEYAREQASASGKDLSRATSPEFVGIFMVGMGVISLIFGIIENIENVKLLTGQYNFRRTRYALFMAVILSIFGLFLLLLILFRIIGVGS
jgi:inner membrane protein YidH